MVVSARADQCLVRTAERSGEREATFLDQSPSSAFYWLPGPATLIFRTHAQICPTTSLLPLFRSPSHQPPMQNHSPRPGLRRAAQPRLGNPGPRRGIPAYATGSNRLSCAESTHKMSRRQAQTWANVRTGIAGRRATRRYFFPGRPGFDHGRAQPDRLFDGLAHPSVGRRHVDCLGRRMRFMRYRPSSSSTTSVARHLLRTLG